MEKFLKIVKVLTNTLTALIIIFGLIFVILYAIGIQPFVVQSGSMEDAIQTGSLSFINKHVSYNQVKVGDIIGYSSSTNQNVMHRVVAIDSEGIHTKGDANEIEDGNITTEKNYIGKAIFWVPKLGYAVALIQTVKGKIVLGTVIVMMILSALLIGEPSKRKKNILQDKVENSPINEIENKTEAERKDEEKVKNENKTENNSQNEN